MRRRVLVLCAAAVALAGCGGEETPTPPRAGVIGAPQAGHAAPPPVARRSFDPVSALLRCLREQKVPASRSAFAEVRVGDPGQGLRVRFLATEGEAQTAQLQGRAEGAEVIGRALLYPGTASEQALQPVETCTNDAGLKD